MDSPIARFRWFSPVSTSGPGSEQWTAGVGFSVMVGLISRFKRGHTFHKSTLGFNNGFQSRLQVVPLKCAAIRRLASALLGTCWHFKKWLFLEGFWGLLFFSPSCRTSEQQYLYWCFRSRVSLGPSLGIAELGTDWLAGFVAVVSNHCFWDSKGLFVVQSQ